MIVLLFGYSLFILYLQTEKCFCAKGDTCPSNGEAVSSDHDCREKVKVCLVLVYLYMCVCECGIW